MLLLFNKQIFAVIGLMVVITVALYSIQDHGDESCDIFELHHECDLSGWITLIYGDLLIGITLALVFHYMVSDSNKKIAAAALKTDKVLSEMRRVHDRRKAYVIQALKNHFSSLLLCVGMINRFINSDDEKKKNIAESKKQDLNKILQKSQMVLDLSIDVLDPMLVEKIQKIFTVIEDSMEESDKGMIVNADQAKTLVKEVTEKLDEESKNIDKILK